MKIFSMLKLPKSALILTVWPLLTLGAADFTIVPEQSFVALSGTAIGFTLLEQGAGSLSTKYRGTIKADVGNGIKFTGSSTITADDSGSWQPLANGESGSAPAAYGGKADGGFFGKALAAVRNLQLDVTSDLIPINGTSFDSASLLFNFVTNANGALDYAITGLLSKKDSVELAGYATNRLTTAAALETNGNTQTLTIPVDAEFYFKLVNANDTKFAVKGQLVATRTTGNTTTPTFAEWIDSKFQGQTDPNIVGPDADPDNDGLPNFVEYALGLDPKVENQATRPVTVTLDPSSQNEVVVQYVRPKGLSANKVDYAFKTTDVLGNWTPLQATEEVTDLGDGNERVSIRQTISPNATGNRFIVLTVAPK
jgi:hypothetical protein